MVQDNAIRRIILDSAERHSTFRRCVEGCVTDPMISDSVRVNIRKAYQGYADVVRSSEDGMKILKARRNVAETICHYFAK